MEVRDTTIVLTSLERRDLSISKLDTDEATVEEHKTCDSDDAMKTK